MRWAFFVSCAENFVPGARGTPANAPFPFHRAEGVEDLRTESGDVENMFDTLPGERHHSSRQEGAQRVC